MSFSANDVALSAAESVATTADTLTVELSDGRAISVPLAWYPRLLHASQSERDAWRLVGKGEGVHWPGLDEDVSVEGLLAGRPSGESPASLKRWLEARTARRPRRSARGKKKARV